MNAPIVGQIEISPEARQDVESFKLAATELGNLLTTLRAKYANRPDTKLYFEESVKALILTDMWGTRGILPPSMPIPSEMF